MPATTSCCSSIDSPYCLEATPSRNSPTFLAFATTSVVAVVERFFIAAASGRVPFLRAAQQHAGSQQPVDLIGAFEDAIDAGIAIRPLHGIILMVAVAAVDLHGFIHHVIERLRTEDLEEGAFGGELFAGFHQRLARILNVADQAIRHALIHVHPDRHFGQLVLDQAELGDGFSESPALPGVADRAGQRLAAFAVRGHGQRQPPDVQDVERDDVAAADLAQDVFHRDLDVIEIDGGGGAALQSHLLFFGAGRNAGPGAFHQKRRELLAADLGEHRVQVRDAAVGDPHLLAVEHVVRPVGREIRAGARGQRVRSGLRLGESISGDQLGRREPRKILLLLLLPCRTSRPAAHRCRPAPPWQAA